MPGGDHAAQIPGTYKNRSLAASNRGWPQPAYRPRRLFRRLHVDLDAGVIGGEIGDVLIARRWRDQRHHVVLAAGLAVVVERLDQIGLWLAGEIRHLHLLRRIHVERLSERDVELVIEADPAGPRGCD